MVTTAAYPAHPILKGHICVQCGGELFVGLSQSGTVNIDYVYLQPGEWGRFKGLPVKL